MGDAIRLHGVAVTLDQHAAILIAAIRRAVAEHGAPNSFSFGELHLFYGGPSPGVAGRAAREWLMPNPWISVESGRVYVGEGWQ